MADALQEDLYATSYSPGQVRAAAQLRKETRTLIAGTPFAGRRISHAQDSFGNALTAARGKTDSIGAAPARETEPAPQRQTLLPRHSRQPEPIPDLDEADELAALSL